MLVLMYLTPAATSKATTGRTTLAASVIVTGAHSATSAPLCGFISAIVLPLDHFTIFGSAIWASQLARSSVIGVTFDFLFFSADRTSIVSREVIND
jgi:hypothetical protein